MASPTPEEPRVKPTKPDEEAYKTNLAQAEKEHTAAQEKLVCFNYPSFSGVLMDIVLVGSD